MQYELRTQVIEPKRKTFANLTERLGDRPASRYEEGSIDVQAVTNFHYRPLWDPEHEIYDPTYSELRLTDPYSFTDPRQFYYAPYVTARTHLYEAFASTLQYLEDRQLLDRLPDGWKALATDVVLPLRHYETGGQLVSAYGCKFGYGTTITQCLSYASFDRIGNAQLLSRFGISLGGGTDDLLGEAKQRWLTAPWLQPLRRHTEQLLIEKDWAVAHLGLDLSDQLLYGLLYRHLDEAALLGGAGGYSLVANHLSTWFADHRRWADALYQAWRSDPETGARNREVLAVAADRLVPIAADAVRALAVQADAQVPTGAVAFVDDTAQRLLDTFTGPTALTREDPR